MSVPILDDRPPLDPDPLRAAIRQAYRADEAACVARLLEQAALDDARRQRIQARARDLAQRVRDARGDRLGVEAFLYEYGLSTPEGVMLMCLAEALLRIPDPETADRLIRDKLGAGDWAGHLGRSGSLLVNASTWGLMLTGRFVRVDLDEQGVATGFTRLVHRMGEPVVRTALLNAMRLLGRHFVLGQTIEQAIARADEAAGRGYRYSYDMLGEAARTAADAEGYHEAYGHAIEAIARAARGEALMARPSISIKLSALHPRYELAQHRRLPAELLPRLVDLAGRARAGNIAVTIDAEEADRLEPSLDLFERLLALPEFVGWDGLGLAVQAYQKRAVHVIAWLAALAQRHRRRIPVRLVKGAYWDTEIKRAQEQGLAYPVLTRKLATDVSYLACARRLLDGGEAFYPQFATHNAHTIASIVELAGARRDLEFQRLHGMAEALYGSMTGPGGGEDAIACRVYAPVGSHNDLLPYLVRRLLENGANTSFVNQLMDEAIPVERLIEDPARRLAALGGTPHPSIVHPRELYGPERRNATGIDLHDPQALEALAGAMNAAIRPDFVAAPTVSATQATAKQMWDPADRSRLVGAVVEAGPADVDRALAIARAGFEPWDRTPLEQRCACLTRAADLYEKHGAEFMAWCVREGGKTLADAVSELREAVDFLRYYVAQARRIEHHDLPGPTGESNTLGLHGRGVFVTISPWNFPLAIFTGQVAAALVVGNAVVAKPAPQTPMIAAKAVALLHQAGVPKDVLVMLPGAAAVGERLVAAPGIAGVAFTGSTQVSRVINRALAAKDGPIVPLIAETGGQNVMLVDSSALPEQVVADVLDSAFRSAGQRCSALRVLCLQDAIAARVERMLAGAMDELRLGDPGLLATDVGPVIDEPARERLTAHAERMQREARLIRRLPLDPDLERGCFFAPHAFAIERIDQLPGEVFGPILHVVQFAGDRLDATLDAVNATGYGLTLGVHSRVEHTVQHVVARARVGNLYVNRNMIGAVVGVQPFGGEGLSGTGPKAGGPHYLPRFATERTVSVNTAAIGGNATLLGMDDAAGPASGSC